MQSSVKWIRELKGWKKIFSWREEARDTSLSVLTILWFCVEMKLCVIFSTQIYNWLLCLSFMRFFQCVPENYVWTMKDYKMIHIVHDDRTTVKDESTMSFSSWVEKITDNTMHSEFRRIMLEPVVVLFDPPIVVWSYDHNKWCLWVQTTYSRLYESTWQCCKLASRLVTP